MKKTPTENEAVLLAGLLACLDVMQSIDLPAPKAAEDALRVTGNQQELHRLYPPRRSKKTGNR